MFRTFLSIPVVCFISIFLQPTSGHAQELDYEVVGFTEPFRKIDLSSDETGAIAELSVDEGDFIGTDDVVAKLDDRVQQVQLEIATKVAAATSQQKATATAMKKRQEILNRLRQMKSKGHATDSELIRAELELTIAQANYNNALEEGAVRQAELTRAEVQLRRRTIRAPFSGFVSKIIQREGEFISPLHPEICTIVQIDRLIATFSVNSADAARFSVGDEFEIQVGQGRTTKAVVHKIGIETDPQSGTVEIKFVIENHDFRFRSGESCRLII